LPTLHLQRRIAPQKADELEGQRQLPPQPPPRRRLDEPQEAQGVIKRRAEQAIFATTTTYHAEYFSHDLSCQLYCFVAAPPTPTTTKTQAVGNRGYASTSASMSCSETGRQTDKTTPNAELHQLHSIYSIVLLFLVLVLSPMRGLTLQFEISFNNFRLYLFQITSHWLGLGKSLLRMLSYTFFSADMFQGFPKTELVHKL
jgi:hypothetical protein